jgi:hypothetical protein
VLNTIRCKIDCVTQIRFDTIYCAEEKEIVISRQTVLRSMKLSSLCWTVNRLHRNVDIRLHIDGSVIPQNQSITRIVSRGWCGSQGYHRNICNSGKVTMVSRKPEVMSVARATSTNSKHINCGNTGKNTSIKMLVNKVITKVRSYSRKVSVLFISNRISILTHFSKTSQSDQWEPRFFMLAGGRKDTYNEANSRFRNFAETSFCPFAFHLNGTQSKPSSFTYHSTTR